MDSNLKTSTDRLNATNRRKMSTESNVLANGLVPEGLLLSNCINSTQDLSKYYNQKKKINFRSALPQIFASCCATSFHVIVGVTFAATATLLPQLSAPGSDIQATKSETAWVASVFVLAVPGASLFAGYIMETFGRLNAVKLAIVPSIASCVLIAMAKNVYMVIGGRVLMGVGAALGTNPAVVYITEITSPDYRGALVSAGPTLSSFGMMLGYLTGALVDWRLVSWINVAYCLIPLLLILLVRVPESPLWLISKGRNDEAKKSLQWIWRWEHQDTREKSIEKKFNDLINDHLEKTAESAGETCLQKFSGLAEATGYKPLAIMIVLFAFQQYTGVYITTFYAVQFFEEAGSNMNAFHASILIGLIRFVMSLVTIFLLKKFGRRQLCLASCVGMAILMGISGYFTRLFVQNGEKTMVPVYCILLYVAFCMFGMLSLPWIMAAEVFPTKIRGMAHGIVISSAHIIMFISVQTYFEMAAFFGGHDGLQWFFGIMSVFALVFVYFFLPETQGFTLQEIEEYFQTHCIYSSDATEKKKGNFTIGAHRIVSMDPIKPTERKFSIRNVEILEPVTENLSEYDSLIKQNKETHPSILPPGGVSRSVSNNNIGPYDLSNIEYIDKSVVELDRIPYS